MTPTSSQLFASLDATLWNPSATSAVVQSFCEAAKQQNLRAICLPGSRIAQAYAQLEETLVKVVGLVGFPFGNEDSDVKRFATEAAVDNGAHEIETVLHTGRLQEGATKLILRELRDLIEAADERPICVTLDLARLTREETRVAVELILESGAHSLSTGMDFWPDARISLDEIRMLREWVGDEFIIKAAGGIRDLETAEQFLAAGANRVGTSESFWRPAAG